MPSYVANFNNILPPARFDSNPWTKILVYEAKAFYGFGQTAEELEEDGYLLPGLSTEEIAANVFALIDTVQISSLEGGLDTEPAEPKYRNITVTNCTVEEGFYRFVFEDGGGNTTAPTSVISNAPSPIGAMRPSLEDLGSILRVRTVVPGSGGKEEGTFNTKTRPTAVEAEAIITNAVAQTLLSTGPDIPERFWEPAKTVILYMAAVLLELSFYKNEIDKGISAYPAYQQLYKDSLDGLINSISGTTAASPTQGFFTVPVVTKSQANFRYLMKAINPQTGLLDPTKLPQDMDYPIGPGGLPAWYYFAVNGLPNALDMGYFGNSSSFLDDW